MVSNVEVLRPNSTLREAAKKMKNMDVGVLPVCDGDRVIGMLTDRDIVLRLVAEGLDAERTLADEVMTRNVLYCYEDQTIEDAAERMKDRQVGRLVVLSRDHKLRGIISLGNLSRHLGEDHLANFVAQKIWEGERRGMLPSKRLGTTVGTIAGLVTLAAGIMYFRNQAGNSERERPMRAA